MGSEGWVDGWAEVCMFITAGPIIKQRIGWVGGEVRDGRIGAR
jgi:hypothetical protein